MVKVKLDGLNIVRARGKFYVYHRDTGKPLLKGFVGSHDDLARQLAKPDMIAAYNRHRTRDLKRTYPEGTLGGLVQWFENECPEYTILADATKKDYTAAFAYLKEKDEFDATLASITQPELYKARDTCAMQGGRALPTR